MNVRHWSSNKVIYHPQCPFRPWSLIDHPDLSQGHFLFRHWVQKARLSCQIYDPVDVFFFRRLCAFSVFLVPFLQMCFGFFRCKSSFIFCSVYWQAENASRLPLDQPAALGRTMNFQISQLSSLSFSIKFFVRYAPAMKLGSY
jgi:hypothetical protein